MTSIQRDLEVLRAIRPFITAGEERTTSADWLQRLPASAVDLLDRLAEMEEADLDTWHEQASAEEPELADQILRLLSVPSDPPAWAAEASVFRFTDRVTDVEFSSHLSFEVENPRPIIRLIFLSGEDSDRLAMTSDQDLEDTLHIGKSVCGSITETLRLMQEHGISLRPEHFGESFGEILGELEETVSSLRRLFGATEEPLRRA
jgi:hypothetical protein